MTDKVKELEKQLELARLEEAEIIEKTTGFDVVVFDDDMENLKEIKVSPIELTEKSKANIMKAAGDLGDNLEEIETLADKLDTTVGNWLKLLALIDDPLKAIISEMFNLDVEIVATLPNIELLRLVFQDNPWINSKAGKLAKELDYISKQNK
nr:MAG TPA: hypothetical protein [Caudoviricetes sp.]